jgi:hypothetical protein
MSGRIKVTLDEDYEGQREGIVLALKREKLNFKAALQLSEKPSAPEFFHPNNSHARVRPSQKKWFQWLETLFASSYFPPACFTALCSEGDPC